MMRTVFAMTVLALLAFLPARIGAGRVASRSRGGSPASSAVTPAWQPGRPAGCSPWSAKRS